MSPKKPSGEQLAELVAKRRTVEGTRAVRRLRREGLIPGVVYGKATSPTPVVISHRDLVKFLHARAGEHGLVKLSVETDLSTAPSAKGSGAAQVGGKPWQKPVLIKQLQRDPVTGEVTHVDFHAITLTEQIRIKIPIVLKGEPVGVKQEGGVLEHFLRDIEVECLPTAIPKQVEYDVSTLKIGETIHVRDLIPPEGARITTDPEGVIASVLAPKEEKVEAVAEAVTEPEVIREKKPEAEGEAAEEKPEKAEKPEKPEKAEKKDDK